jgi:hypothetical protein
VAGTCTRMRVATPFSTAAMRPSGVGSSSAPFGPLLAGSGVARGVPACRHRHTCDCGKLTEVQST